MVLFVCCPLYKTTIVVCHPSLFSRTMPKRQHIFYAKLDLPDDDPFFQIAMQRASLRIQETLRSEPLFIDPYIGCLSSSEIEKDVILDSHWHCLATKFIDEKLHGITSETDDIRQVVLLTDGMDTRPYRLLWPASTVIFDVAPDRIFRRSIQKLEEVGARIPRNCVLHHIPSETSDIQQRLLDKGFNGSRPSLWVLQGLPILNLACFKEILSIVSNVVAKGCLFLGELPLWLSQTRVGIENNELGRLFMEHGLRVDVMDFNEVAQNLGKKTKRKSCIDALFVAEQLRFSEDEMSFWRREFQRIEEEGDEEGFEEL